MAGSVKEHQGKLPRFQGAAYLISATQESEKEKKAQIKALVRAGPHFIGELKYSEIPHPREEGRLRDVCLLQVPSDAGGKISSEELANLEYRAEPGRKSVLERLGTEWRAAQAHQDAQKESDIFNQVSQFLLKRDGIPLESQTEISEFPDSFPEKTVKIDNIFEEEEDRWFPDETSVNFALLKENYAYAWAQGNRKEMEDTHCAKLFEIVCGEKHLKVGLTAVYDGHSKKFRCPTGDLCAQLLADHFDLYLKERLERHNRDEMTLEGTWNALKLAFVDFTRTFQDRSGSCANVVVEIERMGLLCANVGDCRAFLVMEDGQTIQLSEDQKVPFYRGRRQEKDTGEPQLPTKAERSFLHRGGLQLFEGRVCGLNIPRTIGDKGGENCTTQYLSARPKIVMPTQEKIEERLGRSLKEGEDMLLVQGCDGLFDVGSTAQYGRFIAELLKQGHSLSDIMGKCVEAAFKCKSQDNLTMQCRLVHFT